MIIRKIGFLVCMLVVCSLNINTAMAQSRSYEGVITVNPVRLEQKGDFIHVDIDFVLNNVKVKSARGMDFIPRLVTPGRTQNLPKVSIKGRDEYLAYERELALMSAKEKRNYEKPYIVEIAGKEKTGRFYYNQKINCMRAEGFAEYGCFMFCGEGAQPVLNVKNTLIHMKKCNIIH